MRLRDSLGYWILRTFYSVTPGAAEEAPYASAQEKLVTHFGPEVWPKLAGKTVIDFGSGNGEEALELARQGARRVIGLDVRDSLIDRANQAAESAELSDRCVFARKPDAPADLVLSLDSFEHFADPAAILQQIFEVLKPHGEAWISFGWPWFHPHGGHLFSVFPWAHLVFSEAALIRWRSDFKTDGATRFSEVEGGLNQMSIARCERILAESPFEIVDFTLRPIHPLRWLFHTRTREFTTSIVFARLRKPTNPTTA